MTLFELSNLLDKAVSRHDSLLDWSYIELSDEDAHIDIKTAFTAFLCTENHFLRVASPDDLICSLVDLS